MNLYANPQHYVMKFTQKHIDFEVFSQQLIGLKVVKVEYAEINYEPENPKSFYHTKYPNLDSVDYSVFLHTHADKLIEIYWDDIFFQFGIGIKINQPSDFKGFIKWDVSGNELWNKFIETTITDVKIIWETVTSTYKYSYKKENYVHPQSIKLTFSNNKTICISASSFYDKDENEVYGMSDNLMVTDNEELARQIKMIY